MQINLNILTENNHSSLLSKNVPTADNALLQYMQKVTQGTNNADTEDKKQQKLQHIVNKLKHGKKLTAQEMEFLRIIRMNISMHSAFRKWRKCLKTS